MKNHYHVQSVPRIFELIAKQIGDYITSKKMKPGDKLPTERKLSELLEVSRSSLREGLRVLELLRFVESRQGEGTFVSEPPPLLIPYQLLDQIIDKETLNHYFELMMMTAEKISFLAVDQKLSIEMNKLQGTNNFWLDFSAMITDLGKQLQNPYYLAMWHNIFSLLEKNKYFEQKQVSVEIEELQYAIVSQNKEKLQYILTKLLQE